MHRTNGNVAVFSDRFVSLSYSAADAWPVFLTEAELARARQERPWMFDVHYRDIAGYFCAEVVPRREPEETEPARHTWEVYPMPLSAWEYLLASALPDFQDLRIYGDADDYNLTKMCIVREGHPDLVVGIDHMEAFPSALFLVGDRQGDARLRQLGVELHRYVSLQVDAAYAYLDELYRDLSPRQRRKLKVSESYRGADSDPVEHLEATVRARRLAAEVRDGARLRAPDPCPQGIWGRIGSWLGGRGVCGGPGAPTREGRSGHTR